MSVKPGQAHQLLREVNGRCGADGVS